MEIPLSTGPNDAYYNYATRAHAQVSAEEAQVSKANFKSFFYKISLILSNFTSRFSSNDHLNDRVSVKQQEVNYYQEYLNGNFFNI